MASRRPADQSAAGKTPNQYIPAFITKKPFYVDEGTSDADYLEHQRLQTSEERRRTEKWYDRGKKAGPAATKFRKGACENCGAMTHKTKDCLSRPRKAGARWTGQNIEADELVEDVALGWDAKRDRWNGYDADEYRQVVDEYNELEDLKKAARGNETSKQTEADEGERYEEEEADMERKQATSSKTLRIREDTAKYLLDLDLDSARYDPKTRTMNDAGATGDAAAEYVAEQNFMRASGDAAEFENAQRYAWETQERGDKDKLHLQANPTSGEYSRRKLKDVADAKKAAQRKALVELYGEQEAANKQQQRIAPVESETFVEYDERGRVKGRQQQKTKSQYAEDVRINNHTSTWGSWWRDFAWGYACCHSTVKNSYCTGEEGLRALEEEEQKSLMIEGAEQVVDADGDGTAETNGHEASKGADSRKRTLDEMRNGEGKAMAAVDLDDAASKRRQVST